MNPVPCILLSFTGAVILLSLAAKGKKMGKTRAAVTLLVVVASWAPCAWSSQGPLATLPDGWESNLAGKEPKGITKKAQETGVHASQTVPTWMAVVEKEASEKPDEQRTASDYLELATKEWKAKKYKKALRLCQAGLARDPSDARLRIELIYQLGLIYADLDNRDFALRAFHIATNMDPNYSWPLCNFGYWHLDPEEGSRAETSMLKAIQLDPMNAFWYNHLSLIYNAQEKYDLSEACSLKASQAEPNSEFPYFNLGSIYMAQEKYDLAETSFLKAIQVNPKNAYFYYNIGALYAIQRKYDLSEAYSLKAIHLDSNMAGPHINLGIIYRDQRKDDLAEASFLKAIQIDPNDPKPQSLLGNLYNDQKKYDKAWACFLKTVKLDPENSDGYCSLGNAYMNFKLYDLAKTYILKSILLNPKNPIAYNSLGVIYWRKGEFPLAEESFKKALQLDPEMALAKANLSNLLEFLKKLHQTEMDGFFIRDHEGNAH